ncbi:hypothetical protein ACS0TY_012449 [Phlomoides rotata]
MQGYSAYAFILCLMFLGKSTAKSEHPTNSNTTFDVTKFGAVGDGRTDDTKAFKSVWTLACNKSSDSSKITVPGGREFLVSSIKFEGPCMSRSITFEIRGTIVAQTKQAWNGDKDSWLYFYNVDQLYVVGNGQGLIDGQGDSWWEHALRFSHCNSLHLSGLKHKNSKKNHVSINQCNNATISNLHMIAPAKSPNTDAIDISSSTYLNIHDCVMETGDDCIAINGGTSNVNISRITCGPGHGISIGSLGKNGKHEEVNEIHVQNCTFIKSQNGVRIKTWQKQTNPVIIDQYYCPHKQCNNKTSAVQVSDVKYIGLRGTAICKNSTINFSCSQTHPCYNILVQDVDIKSADPHVPSSAHCINAHGKCSTTYPRVNCLMQ